MMLQLDTRRSVLGLMALFVLVGSLITLGCGDGGGENFQNGDGGGEDFQNATASDLGNRVFTFSAGVDPILAGEMATLTVGTFNGNTAPFSLTANETTVAGTVTLGSCTFTTTFIEDAGGARAVDPSETQSAERCEINRDDKSLKLVIGSDEFTSTPSTEATPLFDLTIALSPANEVEPAFPLDDQPETGTARLILLPGNLLAYTITVNNLMTSDALTNAHIHYPADSAENGPVFITLVGSPAQAWRPTNPLFNGATTITNTIPLTADEAAELLEEEGSGEDESYVNVHSQQVAGGLVRGQLFKNIVLAFNTPLSTENEVPLPAAPGPERGVATLRLLDDNTLEYTLTVNNLTPGDALTNAHIHMGSATVSGDIFITLVGTPSQASRPENPQFNGTTTITNDISLTADEVMALQDPEAPFYVNIHSTNFGAGLVRGQLRDAISLPPVSFAMDIQPIFTANCAKAGCHVGTTPPPASKPMNLEAGQAYMNIVGVASGERPLLNRVEPGDPDNSYLFLKHTGAAGIGGSRMPLDNPTFFDTNPDLLDLERRWIEEGALNN